MKKSSKKKTPLKRKVVSRKKSGWKLVLHKTRYIPAITIALFATIIGYQPQLFLGDQSRGVLAYATNVSPSGLLTSTNQQRSSHGVGTLASNGLLASAAQTKAEDMVNRNYWSHATPDGQQPWVFITNAGYQYTSAGENLAYGFMTSSDTVTGWMNSPAHKDNLLSSRFTEVGFGIANSPNFVGDGQQTVVVAMYGAPQAAPAPAPAPVASTKPASTKTQVAEAPAAEPEAPAEEPVEEPEEAEKETIAVALSNSSNPTATASPASINRVQLLTNGNAAWSATAVLLAVCATGVLWTLHRGMRLRQFVKASERFVAHHVHIDLAVLAVVYLGFVLLSSTGAIR